jgi:hypothetical protein
VEASVLGNTEQAADAFRRVSVEPIEKGAVDLNAKAVLQAAKLNLRAVPGSFSRRGAKLGLKGKKVSLSGTLALVAEYGMNSAGWFMPRKSWKRPGTYYSRRIRGTGVPPDRFGSGRPGPEDGWVIGRAWKLLRKQLAEETGDETLDAYMVELDSEAGNWRGKVKL